MCNWDFNDFAVDDYTLSLNNIVMIQPAHSLAARFARLMTIIGGKYEQLASISREFTQRTLLTAEQLQTRWIYRAIT